MADDLEYMDANVIDLSLLTSTSPTVAAEELRKLKHTIDTWGCFQIANIGLSTEFLNEVRGVIKQFFALPHEEKMKHSRTPDNPQGYGIDGDPKDPSQASSRLFLTIYPNDQRSPDRWPATPQEFRNTLHEYAKTVRVAHDLVVRAIARTLNLEDHKFIEGYGNNPQIVARINYYPPCPHVDLVRKLSRHADVSGMTFLLIDKDVEALEILKGDQWFKVPIIPHAIVVLVGDQMEMMSNGLLKSAEHRVKPNLEKERISIALFCSPDLEKEVGPLKELVSEDHPPLYKTVTSYINLFERHYTKGMRPIMAVKI